MARVKPIERDSLAADQQEVWDDISASRGGIHGPYAVLIRLPELAKRMAELGNYFRQHGILPAWERELAILAAAREIGSRYEWFRHEPVAREAGTRAVAIEAVRTMSYRGLSERELVIVEVVQTLFRAKMLPHSIYNNAVQLLGENEVIELVTLAGFYCSIAFILLAYEISLPAGSDAPF